MKYFTKIFSFFFSDKKIYPSSRYPFPEKSDLYPLVVSLDRDDRINHEIKNKESKNIDTEINPQSSDRLAKMLKEIEKMERKTKTGTVVPFDDDSVATPRESNDKPLNKTPSTSTAITSHNSVASHNNVSSNTTSPDLH